MMRVSVIALHKEEITMAILVWIFIVLGAALATSSIVAIFWIRKADLLDKYTLYIWCAIGIVVGLLLALGNVFWLYGTESGARAIKSFHSEITGGLSREIRVYDMEGDLIEQYEGKFDVKITDGKILFDMPSTDGASKRVQILHSTGTVVIEEK